MSLTGDCLLAAGDLPVVACWLAAACETDFSLVVDCLDDLVSVDALLILTADFTCEAGDLVTG